MNWIQPSFELTEFSLPPPTKKLKLTEETVVPRIQKDYKSFSSPNNWLQKYRPQRISELGVQINKVKELEHWLLRSKNKLLLLTGPTGCGKTTTLQVVCKSLGLTMFEYLTPVKKFETCDLPGDVLSSAMHFQEYLTKTSRYGSCLSSKSSKSVILVKDIPNIFLMEPSVFHEVLENVSDMCLKNPIVFICSQSSMCRKLFPKKLLVDLKCKISVIRFRPITNLEMVRILKIIVNKERQVNKEMQILCDKRLGSICWGSKGDIRNSINSLYFHCVKPSVKIDFSLTQTPEKLKDTCIDFFHGIGEVLTPKKSKLQENKFTTKPENIVEQFLGESKQFVSRLNEHFYTKFENIPDLSNAAQRLSVSDVLLAGWKERDIFNEYSLSVAVRGVMVTNTNPPEPFFQFYGNQKSYHYDEKAKNLQLEGKLLFPDLCALDNSTIQDILP